MWNGTEPSLKRKPTVKSKKPIRNPLKDINLESKMKPDT
jgi:hypothetical protein